MIPLIFSDMAPSVFAHRLALDGYFLLYELLAVGSFAAKA